MLLKKCSKCGKEKELTSFRKDKTKKDGYYNSCKECGKEKDSDYYKRNSEQKKAKVIEYQKKTGRWSAYKPYNPKYYSNEHSKLKSEREI